MNESIAINNPSMFKSNISVSKRETLDLMTKKIDNTKLNIIKQYMKENNITFNDNINDLQEFIEKEVSKLDSKRRNEVDIVLKNSDEEFKRLIGELRNGSTTAFRNFLTNTYSGLVKGTAVALAERTALIMAPTLESKLLVGAGIVAHTTYKLVKNNKYKNIVNQNYECNRILQELETTKDSNGRIIDTRFNNFLQETIINFLKYNNIEFENTGYLSLRECIYNMNLYNRIALANVINNMTGNKIDVNGRISKYDRSIREKLKSSLKPAIALTSAGLGSAALLNSAESTIIAASANGVASGTLISKLTDSPVAGWITGIVGSLGTVGTKLIPLFGGFFDKIYKAETILILGALGAIVGFGGLIGNKVFKSIKSIIDKKNNSKEQRLILETDRKIYYKDNEIEYQKILKTLQDKGQSVEELAILGIAKTYMKEQNLKIDDDISTIEGLKLAIQNSDSKDKTKILKLVNYLDDYNTKDKNAFKRIIKKIGKTLFWATTLGLAGLSIWDILSGGGFLNELSEKTFANTDNLLKEMPSVSRENYAPKSHDVGAEGLPPLDKFHPSHGGSINPNITPAPAPAPTMEVYPTSPPPVPPDTTYIDALNNTKDFAIDVSKMSTDEAYKTLAKIGNNGLLSHCIDNLDNSTIKGLIEYMSSSPDVDSKSIPYKMLENLLNNRVNKINNYIKTVRGVTKVAANIASPIVAGVQIEKEMNKEI